MTSSPLRCSRISGPRGVVKLRGRFAEFGLEGLSDASRSGRPRTYDDEAVYDLVVKTLNEKPRNATHRSTRSMAEAAGVSRSFVRRVWRTFELKPHLTQEFKVSPDVHFTEKLRDVVGLYLNPPESAVVLCLDEKTQTAGPGPHSTDPASAAHHTRTQNPRLPQMRYSRTHDYTQPSMSLPYIVASKSGDVAEQFAIVDNANIVGFPPLYIQPSNGHVSVRSFRTPTHSERQHPVGLSM